jgi:predicted CXXCH cytochrome family protein
MVYVRYLATAFIIVIAYSLLICTSQVAAQPAKPPRVEVTVTSQGAPTGYSTVTLRWETQGNYVALQKLISLNPKTGKLEWQNRSVSSSGGYYTYSEVVQNYTNVVYRMGKDGIWQEVRVYPPNVNAHANYTKNTDTCKSCHQTHYAVHPKLLSHRVVLNLCISCHDGSGSKYNVMAGTVIVGTTGQNLRVSSPAGPFSTSQATSYHNVFLEGDGMELMAPGGDKMSLTCTDCHSAHVTPKSSPFRLLKFKEKGPIQAYTYINGGTYNSVYINYMNDFCAECHEHYNYDNHRLGAGVVAYERTNNGITTETYRHPTGIEIGKWLEYGIDLPLEVRDGGSYMTCKTCHFAHGTTVIGAQESPEPGMVKYDQSGRRIGASKTTMLKRQSNMGICMECHLNITWNTPWAVDPKH